MTSIPKLPYFSTEDYAKGVKVSIVNVQAEGKQCTPFEVSRIVIAPNTWTPMDQHEVKECWFISSGNGLLEYDGQEPVSVGAGDVLLYDSQHSHRIYNAGVDDLVVFSLWWSDVKS